MSTYSKVAGQLARKFFKLSVVDGVVSPERVAGILEYIEIHRPANPIMVLRAYHRLVAIELARSAAVVEHAGPITDAILQGIAAAMAARYKCRVETHLDVSSSRGAPASAGVPTRHARVLAPPLLRFPHAIHVDDVFHGAFANVGR